MKIYNQIEASISEMTRTTGLVSRKLTSPEKFLLMKMYNQIQARIPEMTRTIGLVSRKNHFSRATFVNENPIQF